MGIILKIFTNRYVLIGVAVIAALVAVFEYGHSSGYKAGHDDGYATAWNTQQQTINKMTAEQNALTQQQNDKISTLEASANTAWAQVQAEQAKGQKAASDAILAYKKANPQIAQSCGWSPATVKTINQILKGNQ